MTRRIHIYGLIATLLFLFGTSYVFAQDMQTSTPKGPVDLPEGAQGRAGGSTTPSIPNEERREEHRAALLERLQDRIANLRSNVEGRFAAAINRLENISGRLETRIEKLHDMGVDTEAAEAKLNEVEGSLETAGNLLEDIGSVDEALTSDAPREAFMAMRDEFRAIHGLLRQAHADLRATVALLKEAVQASELGQGVSEAVRNNEATSTEEDTDDNNQ